MARQVTESALVVASHNGGKVREIRQFLRHFALSVSDAKDLSLSEPDETEKTYRGNAILKARAAAEASGVLSLADDSGFEMMALDGEPGIYSARWAGDDRDFGVAMERVQAGFLASGSDNRHCRFVCALCLAWPDGETESVEGVIDGDYVWPPRGGNGFGYDPVFVLRGESATFGEMTPEQKHHLSHRAKAFELLVAKCFGETPRKT